jgi:hypothetical protein
VGVVVFVIADLNRMKGMRSIAVSMIIIAYLLALAAALIAWCERRRR